MRHAPSDTIMDPFSDVRPISVDAVFRRRSRHGRYMMTPITTVRRNARFPTNYGSVGPKERGIFV